MLTLDTLCLIVGSAVTRPQEFWSPDSHKSSMNPVTAFVYTGVKFEGQMLKVSIPYERAIKFLSKCVDCCFEN